jgi:coenzyme F420-reducing hydrogenase delta subunit
MIKVLAFCCEQSATQALEQLPAQERPDPATWRIVKVPCSGSVEIGEMLKGLEEGAERVLVLACHPDACQYYHGNRRCEQRVGYVKKLLKETGLDETRIAFRPVANIQTREMLDIVREYRV